MNKIIKIANIFFINLILSNLCCATVSDSDLIINGFNEFAFNLYHQQKTTDQNVIISPYSLSSLLGILVPGTAGNTRTQLMKVLSIKNIQDINQIPIALENLTATEVANKDQKLLAANALWADINFSYKPSFLNSIQQNKAIKFETLDFNHQPEASRQTINQWVEQHTNNLIKDLMAEGTITSYTRLVLTNAIYFKGLWESPFQSDNTQQKPFTLPNHHEIKTATMHQNDKFLYSDNDFMQMLQLKYHNSNLAMAILLPKPKHTLTEVSKLLNTKIFFELVSMATPQMVDIFLPKFKFESTFDALTKSMQSLGLRDAFTQKANFSNLTDDKLFISDIIQKAVIQVDEKGTVAAAATGIAFVTTAYVEPIVFNANRPFLFIIFDTKSRIILFMGQVTNPQTK